MTAATFDTLSAARALKAAGIEPEHAEAIAGTVRQATAADRDALATKADLAELETRLRAAAQADIAGLRAELGTVRWTVGLIAAFLFAIGLRVFGLI